MKPLLYTPLRGGIYIFVLLFIFILPLAVAQSGKTNDNNQNDAHYHRFNPSMVIIIIILIAALFLMGFFSIYIRHCADSPFAASIRNLIGAATGLSRRGKRGLVAAVIATFPTLEYSTVKIHKIAAMGLSRRGKRGLDAAVIATFPTLEYSTIKIHKIGKATWECGVCLCELEETENCV